MKHARLARVEDLEGRMLLSGLHHPVAHHSQRPHHAAVAKTSLVLDGTLTVNNNAATQTQNPDGSTTVTVPVAGQLGAMGQVRGMWSENVDSLGQMSGPDTIRLDNSQGAILLSFNNGNAGRPHRNAQGHVYYQHNQILTAGRGAYANSTENGTIELVLNNSKKSTVQMTIQSRS
jgi:hypothetical protein